MGFTKEEAVVHVTRTVISSGKQDTLFKEEKIPIRPFITATASVSVKYGRTIKIADYESLKIDVMVSCPCYKEEINDVYMQVQTIAQQYIEEHIEAAEDSLGKG